MREEGTVAAETMSPCKRSNSGKALEIVRMVGDGRGGNGIDDTYHVIRRVMNKETINMLEGTHDIHAPILGRAQTGIQAFKG